VTGGAGFSKGERARESCKPPSAALSPALHRTLSKALITSWYLMVDFFSSSEKCRLRHLSLVQQDWQELGVFPHGLSHLNQQS